MAFASINKEIVNNDAFLSETGKKNLGGYKHKLTGKIYHHAMVQTEPPPWKCSFYLGLTRYVLLLFTIFLLPSFA